jgi:DNA-binding IclR family transcriptional regulator
VSKGTLRDVLLAMQEHGLVERDTDARFRLGDGLVTLGDAARRDGR